MIPLNPDIGYLLIKYLGGCDAINFLEAVNGSEQFQTIETTEEWFFYKIFMKFDNKEKTRIDVPYLAKYLNTSFVNEESYLCPNIYHSGEPPTLRLFIHPTFTVEAFKHFCCTYKTSSFQCYKRLSPFNTHSYADNLMLVDYFKYKDSIGVTRSLSDHERSLFKGASHKRHSNELSSLVWHAFVKNERTEELNGSR